MPSILDRMIDLMTDNYSKSPASKIYKLYQVVAEELTDIKETYHKIEDWRDVDNAEGEILDDIGRNLMQFRGETDDDIYRVLIKSRVARNRADGTLNKMVEVLSLALGTEHEEIIIEEGDTEFHTIQLVQIPLNKLAEIGLSTTAFGRIVAKLVAAGVRIETIEFFGTFAYSEEFETGSLIGFADVDMTTGGTLGDLYQPATDPEFPL